MGPQVDERVADALRSSRVLRCGEQAGQLQQQQQRGVVPENSPSAAGAPSRSMTARPEGALGQDEEDPLFDDPEEVAGEELEGLLRLSPPATSKEPVVAQIKQDAIDHPETIRDFIKRTAVRLAKEYGCLHSEPLVTWNEDREDMQEVLDRQMKIDGDKGYCMARRVRNQVYYDTSVDLECTGAGNQCTAGGCMKAALQVYAGVGNEGMPSETVRAMCKY